MALENLPLYTSVSMQYMLCSLFTCLYNVLFSVDLTKGNSDGNCSGIGNDEYALMLKMKN